jgi:hypothetical protein
VSLDNLRLWYARADAIDRLEGSLAYPRYNVVMQTLSHRFGISMPRVTAAFVSLSPNNDYMSNLRSTVTVLDGIKRGFDVEQINVSTYRHCLKRAWAYATGEADFLIQTKGPKVVSFYMNILHPEDGFHVTVDGHIHACWQNDDAMTMKQAVLRSMSHYTQIRAAVQLLAQEAGVIPNAYQASLWFARKRNLGILFNPQGDMLYDQNDRGRTLVDVAQMPPYPPRRDLGPAGRSARVPLLPPMGPGLWGV